MARTVMRVAVALAAMAVAVHGSVSGKLTAPGGTVFEHFVTDSALQAPAAGSADRDSPVNVADPNFHLGTDMSLVMRADGPSGTRAQLKQLEAKSWLSSSEFGERRSVSGEILLVPDVSATEITFAQIGGNVTDDPVVRLVYHKGRYDDQNGDSSDSQFYTDHVWAVLRPEIGGSPGDDTWVRLSALDVTAAVPFEIEVLNDRAEVSVDETSTEFDVTGWGNVQSHFIVGVFLNAAGQATASFPSLNYGY